jgi:hypothetical protein
MIYVYAPRLRTGTMGLIKELNAIRLKRFDGMQFWRRGQRVVTRYGDTIICWGQTLPLISGTRVLNSSDCLLTPSEEQFLISSHGGRYTMTYRECFGVSCNDGIPKTHGGYLISPDHSNCITRFFRAEEEYKIHVFNGRVILSGVKVIKPGMRLARDQDTWLSNQKELAHPWFRSQQAGWITQYEGFASSAGVRRAAKDTIATLGLLFGVVNVFQCSDYLVIRSVEKGPSLDDSGVRLYAQAIRKYLETYEHDTDIRGTESTDFQRGPNEVWGVIQQAPEFD